MPTYECRLCGRKFTTHYTDPILRAHFRKHYKKDEVVVKPRQWMLTPDDGYLSSPEEILPIREAYQPCIEYWLEILADFAK